MIKWDASALSEIVNGPAVEWRLLDLGNKVAHDAALHAPVREQGSQGGARSIHAVLVRRRGRPEVHVSWDRQHFYMQFHELGTERLPALAFLRNAARRYQ